MDDSPDPIPPAGSGDEPETPSTEPSATDTPWLAPSPPAPEDELEGDTPPDDVADGILKPLAPGYLPAETIATWIVAGLFMTGGLIAAIVLTVQQVLPSWGWPLPWLGWMLLASILASLAHLHPRWSYRYTRYALDPLSFEIHKGRFFRHVISVPTTRVQHTDVAQGPLQRRYEIATLTVHTAGTEHASVSVEGLGYEDALRIREYLIRGGDQDAV